MNDLTLAKRYVIKARNAREKGLEFDLPFHVYKKLMLRKTCTYSGLTMTDEPGHWTKRSLDRIDNDKGYEVGNVVAVCEGVNRLKGAWENPNNPLTFDMVRKILDNINDERSE